MMLGLRSRSWVVLAYSLGGIAAGTFQQNLLNCLTPLGHRTKLVAISAIPVGISCVLIGGFFAMGPPLHLPPSGIFLTIAVLLCIGMAVMAFRIPDRQMLTPFSPRGGEAGMAKLAADTLQVRCWLPEVWHCSLAMMVNMCCLAAFNPGVILYVYDQEIVNLSAALRIPTDHFFAAFNTFGLWGGLTGRYLSYRLCLRHPLIYCGFSVAGISLILQWEPLLAPVGIFLVTLGDGLIYGSISRRVDERVPKQFNLIAITVWLLFGDLGSILGQNLIMPIRGLALGV